MSKSTVKKPTSKTAKDAEAKNADKGISLTDAAQIKRLRTTVKKVKK